MRRHDNENLAEQPSAANLNQESTRAPLWLEYFVLACGCAVLFAGGFGTLLAVIGDFSVPRALFLGAAGTIAGIAIGRPRRRAPTSRDRRATPPAVTMVVVTAAIAAWNAKFEGFHVVVDSDPGVYAVTGRWLADHSSLIVPAGAPWASSGLKISLGSAAGMYLHAGDTLQFQFPHFWPALLGEAYGLGGGTLMFRAPAIIGALGLLTVYVVGCRLVQRPWVVVAAVTALGISLPELAVNRDPLSEPSTQVLLWLGIWLLIRGYEERRFLVSLLAGLAVGATLMTHIDSVIYLAPLPMLGAIAWVATTSSSDRRSLRGVVGGVILGTLPPSLLGTIDVQRRAGRYYDDLHSEVTSLYHALALSIIAAVILVIVWPRVDRLRAFLSSRRRWLAIAAGWTVAVGLLLAWSLRPYGPKAFIAPNKLIQELQQRENVPVQPGRSYAEQSMRWIEWYLGPIGLGLAIAGVALLTVRAIRRGTARWVVLLAMTGPVTALYLYRPSVDPYQIWATRRFVPAILPLLVLAAAIVLDTAATLSVSHLRVSNLTVSNLTASDRTASHRSQQAWPRGILTVGIVGLIAFPLGASLPLRSFQPQANNLALIDRVCKTIGPHASVVFPALDFQGAILPQVIRSWCNDPAAQLQIDLNAAQVDAAAAALRRQGRTLWVLGSNAHSIVGATPGVTPHLLATAANDRQVQQTVTRPPTSYGSDAITIWGAEVGS